MIDRKKFEAVISASPYEKSVARWPDDPLKSAWPGSYKDINVCLAWHLCCEMAAAKPTEPTLPTQGEQNHD